MTITAIIPTCDRAELLREALASVLAQSRKADEIIIVNNGKAEMRISEPGVKVLKIMPYAGVAQARNFGAASASSELIAFLDDDDEWGKDYLQNVERAFADGADCAVSRLDQKRDGVITPYKNAAGKLDARHILFYNPGITGTNTAITKKAFFAVSGYDPKLPPSEDKALVLEIVLRGMKAVALPDNQAVIREHQSGRLTDAAKIAEGIYQFIRKYRQHMSAPQKLQNWLKVYRYRLDAGSKIAFFPFAALYLITRFIK